MAEPATPIRKTDVITESLDELENLCTLHIAAGDKLNDAVKAVCEKAFKAGIRLDPGNLKAYVKARVLDKLDQYHEKQEQLELLGELDG